MTTREVIQQQIDGTILRDVIVRLTKLRDHYPERNQIGFRVSIIDPICHDYEIEPNYKIIVYSVEIGGLFDALEYEFEHKDVPIIVQNLSKETKHEAAFLWRLKTKKQIEHYNRKIKRLMVYSDKVKQMLADCES